MKKTVAIVIFAGLIWGCSHKMAPAKTENSSSNTGSVTTTTTTTAPVNATSNTGPTGSRSTTTTTTANAEAVAGQSTYNAKCAQCHGLKVVSDYTADRWISIMQVMAMKAHLSDTEKSNVLVYVKLNAKQG